MNWDRYFYNICVAVGMKSSCLSRQIGAILVRDKSIIATGFNGPPRGIPHCDDQLRRSHLVSIISTDNKHSIAILLDKGTCPRQIMGYKSGDGLEYCTAAHSERNCLINAARLGVVTLDSTLYLNASLPCKDCLIELINAGIREIVATSLVEYNDIQFLIKYSGIKLRVFD